MKKHKLKGMTLIELIIVMAIMSIIMVVMTVMFSSNTNILNKIEKKSELQLEAQMIQNQMVTVGLGTSGIETIDYLGEGNEIKKIKLIEPKGTAVDPIMIHEFEQVDQKFVYRLLQKVDETVTTKSSKELARHVKSVQISTKEGCQVGKILSQPSEDSLVKICEISESFGIEDVDGIEIEMLLEIRSGGKLETYTAKNSIKFRNFKVNN